MPITAIPKDVELRKISAVQKKALDDLLSKQRENTLLETVISATIPAAAFVGVGGAAVYLTYAYLKDIELPSFEDVVVETGATLVETVIKAGNKIFTNNPVTPEVVQGSTLTRCTRWAVDATDNLARVQKGNLSTTEKIGLATNLKYIIVNMKSEGCSRPSAISQAQWDE